MTAFLVDATDADLFRRTLQDLSAPAGLLAHFVRGGPHNRSLQGGRWVTVTAGISRIGVLGAGIMGTGIAQVALQAGYEVVVSDISAAALEPCERRISAGLAKAGFPVDRLRDVLTLTTNMSDVSGAQLVVEAVSEDPKLKLQLFRQLDEFCRPGTILASNTSSISITWLARATRRPESVIGMHFINPVPRMKLVEVVRGLQTSDATLSAVVALAQSMGKEPVTVTDAPGFAVNRILIPMINEAVFALQERVGSVEALDAIMRMGANHPMGPLELADLIGLDTCLAIMEVLHEGFGEDKYRPCPLLKRMVDAGQLGRKTGSGFYRYLPEGSKEPSPLL